MTQMIVHAMAVLFSLFCGDIYATHCRTSHIFITILKRERERKNADLTGITVCTEYRSQDDQWSLRRTWDSSEQCGCEIKTMLVIQRHLFLSFMVKFSAVYQMRVNIFGTCNVLPRPGVDGRTILEWTLKRQVSMRGIGLIRHRIGIIGEPL